MKKTKLLFTAALLGLPVVGFSTDTIDFDDLGDNGLFTYAPSNHYQSIGVLFSREIPYGDMAGAGWPASFWPTHGGTSPNFLSLTTTYDPRLDIDIYFVVPGTSIPATTDMFRALFGDSEVGTIPGTMEAFDSDGNLIASLTYTTPPEQAMMYELRTNGIARIRLSSDADGCVVDNISYNTPVSSVGTNVTLTPVLSIEPAVRVTWDSQTNRLYQVQWNSMLDTNWHNMGVPVPGTDGTGAFCDTTSGHEKRFYRVVVLP